MPHVRLRRRWASMPATLYAGGWYPMVRRVAFPRRQDDIVFRVEDEEIIMALEALEVTDTAHDFAVWGIGTEGGAVICPEGHAIAGVGPWQSRVRCGKCAKHYEIRTDGPQLPLRE